jgi:PBSX family phage terminase large subunit
VIEPLAGKALLAVRAAEHRLNIFEGSVRSGKTVASLLAFLRFVRSGPEGNLLLAGKTERTLKRNIVDPLTEMLGPTRIRYQGGAGELHLLGRRIYLAGANDERASEKIRGLTLAGAYADELSTFPASFFAMLLSRLSLPGARLFATTNPDAPSHWLLADYLRRAAVHITGDGRRLENDDPEAPDLLRVSFRLPDNPHLPADYIEAISREYVGLWQRRFIDGEWVAAEGAIYDMLDLTPDGPHVVSELPRLEAFWCAIDYGTANPFHALLIGLGSDERLYVAREWRWDARAQHRQLTDAEYAQRLRAWLEGGAEGLYCLSENPAPVPIERIILDPSAASFRAQLQRDGFGWARQADNEVLDGIRATASLLAAGRLRIHASCEHLLRELSGYVWDPKATERGEDAPLKVDDHGADALRYFVASTRVVWRSWLARHGR